MIPRIGAGPRQIRSIGIPLVTEVDPRNFPSGFQTVIRRVLMSASATRLRPIERPADARNSPGP